MTGFAFLKHTDDQYTVTLTTAAITRKKWWSEKNFMKSSSFGNPCLTSNRLTPIMRLAITNPCLSVAQFHTD